ncbi:MULTISPECIES: tRNA (adenosine(37)-N6)-threonylcarbamoyltransferase complex transferase subunit TsaD [unclassified Chitinophaga]|uniref:tRNA (adenosine(37)-N6)-threonylcarbamoyltransferase complex transferase subunit TsaD n=1 Tax=unclassified Chitinophaga TaxID=2619133 RepID=UPI0009D200F5|nr:MULTISPECIES: tRNA (adenosine(37)-N6)-threonylcarbamoyltransferase complex transferase subunit TsaD [unclassified Chitinophaga]OMP76207.1 tRNA (adenosine(37)-N6)-threonylcarbamoyltransferase complex transferase subunit TsaD [[Flexibacter] sp. ATCC 35208]WPV65535.1 tRNA (adenosine(37)-N6)-threonylcarbamoyltransferase complex transferase subunit TsaD [Chitinophaga sp. LS1]
MSVKILAIESSCDETSASVLVDGKILSNYIANQTIHEQYGGVVPELASRAHQENIVPVVDYALKQAGIRKEELDAIAFTQAPGLIGALLVGSCFAKSLALALNKPLIAVHHMQAHVLANFIEDPIPSFPFLCLTVSGGHTQIVRVDSPLQMKVIGETMDDAAGEAFDKSAKLLGLPYPGGPLIDKYAKLGDPTRFKFPEPQIPELNFSFSGLKTAILYFLQEKTRLDPDFVQHNMADICASIQHRIVSILMNKLVKASKETGIKEIGIAGGVSANSGLRMALQTYGEKFGWNTYIPKFEYCTDNAAMIAITAYYKYQAKEFVGLDAVPGARAAF